MKLCGGAKLVDGVIEEPEGIAERMGEVVGRVHERGGAWTQDAQVDLGGEEGDA